MNTDPAPTSEQSHDQAGSKARSRLRLTLFGLVAALLVATGLLAFTQRTASGQVQVPARDVPRVEGDRISFSSAFAQRAGLKTETVSVAPFVPEVSAVGSVDFDPQHISAVGTRLRGLVTRVVRFEGDTVEKGTLLAVIESAELGEAQANVQLLKAEHDAAEINAQREAHLVERNLSTAREAEVAAVELRKYQALLDAAKQKVAALGGGPVKGNLGRLGAHELRALASGTIIERNISAAQSVEGDLVAFKIADLDHLWVELQVFERNLSRIKLEDPVELTALAAPDQVFRGRVARIAAQVDSSTRTAAVRVEVDNRDRRLRAGQALNARIRASGSEAQSALLVESGAVTYVDGKPIVFVADGPNRVRVAKVELGASNGKELEVLSGLSPGDRIVTEGAFALKSELFR